MQPTVSLGQALSSAPSFLLAPRVGHPVLAPHTHAQQLPEHSPLRSYRLALLVSHLLAGPSLASGERLQSWQTRLLCAGLWLSW